MKPKPSRKKHKPKRKKNKKKKARNHEAAERAQGRTSNKEMKPELRNEFINPCALVGAANNFALLYFIFF
jgi:hypothetical protein